MNVISFTKNGNILVIFSEEEGIMTVPDDPANRDRQRIVEWEALGNIIPPYVPPAFIPSEPNVQVIVLADLTIDGDIVQGVETSRGLSGVWKETTGRYWCFFTTEQLNTKYVALAYDGGLTRAFVLPQDKFEFGCVVTAILS